MDRLAVRARRFGTVGSVALAFLASGCGGRGGSVPAPAPSLIVVPTSPPGQNPTAIRVLVKVLSLPKGTPPQAGGTNAQSVSISLDGAAPKAYSISPTTPGCSPGTGGESALCTITEDVASGSHRATIATYSGQNGTGNLLSQNSVSASVAAGQIALIPTVVNATPSGIVLALAQPQLQQSVAATTFLSVNTYDSSGDLIVGYQSFSPKLVVQDSDQSGGTSLVVTSGGGSQNAGATASIGGSGQLLSVDYDGKPLSRAIFTATYGSIRTNGAQSASLGFNVAISHVVFVVQENRSVDNLFNGFPGADTVQSGPVAGKGDVALQPFPLDVPWDISHTHGAWTTEYNAGAMNGFGGVPCGTTPCPPANAAYSYVPQSDVQPYWTMAQSYAFADRMFETNEGPSAPAHMYLIAGTSAVDNSNTLSVMNNGLTPAGKQTSGCDAPTGTTIQLINPATNDQSQSVFPCFDHTTLWDSLDALGISWKYYQPQTGDGLWYTPDAIRHIRYGADFANVSVPSTTIFNDITNNALPSVSWVIPTAAASDHAGMTDGSGPAWVASIVNAVGSSSYWNDTAVVVVWDDWGGWYDHVAPQQYNYYELGFRVPLIVVSPYARHGYVSHVQHEFGSLLRFTEETLGVASMGTTDKRGDDLTDMFDFKQSPPPFKAIPAPALRRTALFDTRNPDSDR